jgi:hypothetical protein
MAVYGCLRKALTRDMSAIDGIYQQYDADLRGRSIRTAGAGWRKLLSVERGGGAG